LAEKKKKEAQAVLVFKLVTWLIEKYESQAVLVFELATRLMIRMETN